MTGIRKFFRDLWGHKRGNVTVIVALAMIPTVATVGGGIDFGRAISARAHLQDAADSAAIAAALNSTGVLANQKTAAGSAFTANIANTELSTVGATGELTTTTTNNVQIMVFDAKASMPTYLLGLVGMDKIDITAQAKAGVTINSAEIAFVLDNTGSMAQNSKMTYLKSSVDTTLASLLDSTGKNAGNTKVALVPFDTQVALNNVAGMTGYVGNFTSVSQAYSCTSITAGQCDAVTTNYPTLCSSISSSYGSSYGTQCTTNIVNYTRTTSSYYYVYSTTYFNNPNYNANCHNNCGNGYSYRYITYYRVAAYSISGSNATQSGSSTTQGYYTSSASGMTPNSAGINNSNSYSSYGGTIAYTYPAAGGYGSGGTDIKDNNTITANSDLLGVGTQNWSGCVIDRTQPYDVQSDSPVSTNANTMYPAAKCATNSLLPIMDLTTDIAAARVQAAKMTPAGNTNITIGIQWGMEVLSPNAPFTGGAAFTDPTISKYMIVLTDGLNTQNRWSTTASTINARTALACTNAKALGITVFTIRVEQGDSDMLQTCASQAGYYYNLSNGNQISGALGSIMKSIKKIRLTK